MRELEVIAADALEGASKRRPPPEAGASCANCGAPLAGPYCYKCGQNADLHKRSIGRLLIEGVEGVFHLDGRVMRTVPDLFIHPGRLARDFLEGRLARHVPPFRMFLVALLVWVFAAEFAAHHSTLAFMSAREANKELLQTPAGRAKAAAEARTEAQSDLNDNLKDAANDRTQDLKDPDADKAKIETRYQVQVALDQARFKVAMANADQLAKGGTTVVLSDAPPPGLDPKTQAWWNARAAKAGDPRVAFSKAWWIAQVRKAQANPEYYLSIMFTWGHRVAFLLLPIVGLSLAAVYFYKRRFFIYDHMVTAMNFLSFLFLANAPGFLLPEDASGVWFTVVGVWTPINLYQTLHAGYGSSRFGAIVKAITVWWVSFIAFWILVAGLMTFTLTQI